MSVFTSLEKNTLQSFLNRFGLGALLHYEGATHGIENSNYFITTGLPNGQKGHFVLTLFEQLGYEEIPFYIALLNTLKQAGLPVPAALADQQGDTLFRLAGKPCILVPRFKGHHVEQPNLTQCQQLGRCLGKIHLATASQPFTRENDRHLPWMDRVQAALAPILEPEANALLASELRSYHQNLPQLHIPKGLIHSDLFRDNALFEDDQLSGVIDFYNACSDFFLYDLAVTVNDWCIKGDGALHRERAQHLISAYQTVRPLNAAEKQAWPLLLRFAACRFWLSRLESWYLQPAEPDTLTETPQYEAPQSAPEADKIQIITTKNPQEFERILRHRVDHPLPFIDLVG